MKKGFRIILSVFFLTLALGFIGFGIYFARLAYQELIPLHQDGMLERLMLSMVVTAVGTLLLYSVF